MRYANKTGVGSDRSRAEIEKTLNRYGATAFMYANGNGQAAIMFEASHRRIKMVLPLPDPKDFEKSPKGRKWDRNRGLKAWEQAGRQRWRALALVVKAKLEAVESGVATFEQEFLAYTMLPNGKTVGDSVLLDVAAAYDSGKVTPLLLGIGNSAKEPKP